MLERARWRWIQAYMTSWRPRRCMWASRAACCRLLRPPMSAIRIFAVFRCQSCSALLGFRANRRETAWSFRNFWHFRSPARSSARPCHASSMRLVVLTSAQSTTARPTRPAAHRTLARRVPTRHAWKYCFSSLWPTTASCRLQMPRVMCLPRVCQRHLLKMLGRLRLTLALVISSTIIFSLRLQRTVCVTRSPSSRCRSCRCSRECFSFRVRVSWRVVRAQTMRHAYSRGGWNWSPKWFAVRKCHFLARSFVSLQVDITMAIRRSPSFILASCRSSHAWRHQRCMMTLARTSTRSASKWTKDASPRSAICARSDLAPSLSAVSSSPAFRFFRTFTQAPKAWVQSARGA
mmetsp:Transcript_16925/g.50679  ORF Transcript_16925/g.50679 Transcript_16925/m.50679 type:complete len:348 (-) Transcript_16925:2185-3228(-)